MYMYMYTYTYMYMYMYVYVYVHVHVHVHVYVYVYATCMCVCNGYAHMEGCHGDSDMAALVEYLWSKERNHTRVHAYTNHTKVHAYTSAFINQKACIPAAAEESWQTVETYTQAAAGRSRPPHSRGTVATGACIFVETTECGNECMFLCVCVRACACVYVYVCACVCLQIDLVPHTLEEALPPEPVYL